MSRRCALAAAAISWSLSACSEPTPPAWVPLTFATGLVSEPIRLTFGERELELLPGPEPILAFTLRRSEWTRQDKKGWTLELGLEAGHRPKIELLGPDGPIEFQAGLDILRTPKEGCFTLFRGTLALAGSNEPPESARLQVHLSSQDVLEAGRFQGPELCGRGFTLFPTGVASTTTDIPADAVLCFGLAISPLVAASEGQESLLRVMLDGATIHEERAAVQARSPYAWFRIPLPPKGRAGARVEFQFEGALAQAHVVDPRLAPLEIGRPGQRPWADPRPDIVILLADTYRADNLAAYGGEPGLTPNLDRLADEGLCFQRAWSSSTWTVPSHAAIFSGSHPPQVRVAGHGRRLSDEVVSIIERLDAAGYRTGAMTDGGFVSFRFGFGQGFALFSERSSTLTEMIEDAEGFLAADDGRPAFVFLHTYRAHWPYRVSDETRARLGIESDADELLRQTWAEAEASLQGAKVSQNDLPVLDTPRMRALVAGLEQHYRGGSADLDLEFGAFLARRRSEGFFERGFVLFTSDHGEAFGEHGLLFHGHDPHEELTRIPLILTGRGIQARRSQAAVGHVDIAPTLAELAGLTPESTWAGRSLLAEGAERALFAFEAGGGEDDTLSLLEHRRKVILKSHGSHSASSSLVGAFELEPDPLERSDKRAEPWAGEFVRAHAEALRAALEPRVEGQAAVIDAEKEAELEALGY